MGIKAVVGEDGSSTDMQEWLKRRKKKWRKKFDRRMDKEKLDIYLASQEASDIIKERKRREQIEYGKKYASTATKKLRNA